MIGATLCSCGITSFHPMWDKAICECIMADSRDEMAAWRYYINEDHINFMLPGIFTKVAKSAHHFPSVCLQHLQTRLPMDGFLWNSILKVFIEICRENPNSVIIRHFTWRTKYIYIVDSDMKYFYRRPPPAKMLLQPRKYKQFTIFCT
jgi:hypothetical protein